MLTMSSSDPQDPRMNSDRQGPSDRFLNLPFMRKKDHSKRELHLPLIGYLPNRVRNHLVAMIGESVHGCLNSMPRQRTNEHPIRFVGTFLFLFFAFAATQVANASSAGGDDSSGGLTQVPNASALTYIALGFGFSLAVNAWVFFRVSGGLFNPAVTLGMALIGAVGWTRAGLVFISQIIGSIAAAGVVQATFPGPMNVSTTLGGGTSIVQGLFM
jgi:aquaporin related protein